MRIKWDRDELYPWYVFNSSDQWAQGEIEVTEEEWEEYQTAKLVFFELHSMLVERAEAGE